MVGEKKRRCGLSEDVLIRLLYNLDDFLSNLCLIESMKNSF
jgi:hypothetical protein